MLIKQSEQKLAQPEIHAPRLQLDVAIPVYPWLQGGHAPAELRGRRRA